MTPQQLHQKHLLISILLALSLALMIVSPARAQGGIPPRDEIPAGVTIEGDMLLFGQSVSMDGNVTGDLFVIGSDVQINGEVGGSLYVIAQYITTNGKIGGSAYQGGQDLQLGPDSVVGRNAYLFGVNLSTAKGSQVANDLIAGGLQAWFSGDVGRYMRSIIGILNVEGKIGSGFERPEDSPAESGSAATGGVLALIRLETPIEELIPIGVPSWLSKQGAGTFAQQNTGMTSPVGEWFLDYFRKLVTLLVFGGLCLWLFPSRLKEWSRKVRRSPLESGFWGLIAIFFAVIVSLLIVALIPALVFLLWKLTFWGLASILLTFGYTSYGLAAILFIIASIYISKVIVSYLLGDLILRQLAPALAERAFWSLLLGAVIFMALCQLPMVGWIFALLAALAGLGSMWLVYHESRESAQETDLAGEVVGEEAIIEAETFSISESDTDNDIEEAIIEDVIEGEIVEDDGLEDADRGESAES